MLNINWGISNWIHSKYFKWDFIWWRGNLSFCCIYRNKFALFHPFRAITAYKVLDINCQNCSNAHNNTKNNNICSDCQKIINALISRAYFQCVINKRADISVKFVIRLQSNGIQIVVPRAWNQKSIEINSKIFFWFYYYLNFI